jgi:hypothetical protein
MVYPFLNKTNIMGINQKGEKRDDAEREKALLFCSRCL